MRSHDSLVASTQPRCQFYVSEDKGHLDDYLRIIDVAI